MSAVTILGISGFAVGAVSVVIKAQTTKRLDQQVASTSVRHVDITEIGMLGLAVVAPVVATIVGLYFWLDNPLRTFVNGLALLICVLRLNRCAWHWIPRTDRRSGLIAFATASLVTCAGAIAVILLYTTLWARASNAADGIAKVGYTLMTVFSAPFWFGMYAGVSGLGVLTAVAITRSTAFRAPYQPANPLPRQDVKFPFNPVNQNTDDNRAP